MTREQRIARDLALAYRGDARAFARATRRLRDYFGGAHLPLCLRVSPRVMGRAWGKTYGLLNGGGLILLLNPEGYRDALHWTRTVVHEFAHACAFDHHERFAQTAERRFIATLKSAAGVPKQPVPRATRPRRPRQRD